jgi:hypothetical protein
MRAAAISKAAQSSAPAISLRDHLCGLATQPATNARNSIPDRRSASWHRMQISGSARRLQRSGVQPGGHGIGAPVAAERIGAPAHPAICALEREGQSSDSCYSLFRQIHSLFETKTIPVRIEQGMRMQHTEIAASIDARKRPNNRKNAKFPAIFPAIRESSKRSPD